MGFKLQLQRTFQSVLLLKMCLPPCVDPFNQLTANGAGFLFGMRPVQPDEGRVGVAVDHLITFGLNQFAGLAHNVMPRSVMDDASRGSKNRQPLEPSTP